VRKNTQWTHGKGKFVAPLLPSQLRGITGCLFREAVFDQAVGNEVYLAIFEQAECARDLARLRQFNLFCKNGVVRTSHGLVAFALFTIYDGEEYNSAYELYLNPYEGDTLKLLSSAGLQSHFKVVIYDTVQNRLVQLLEFENVYRFGEFSDGLAEIAEREPCGDFQRAQGELMQRYSMDDLLKL
jgi:hypothetical protein